MKDQASGKVDQGIGKLKQAVGNAVGNDKLANEGVAQQTKGAIKETWGNTKDAANSTVDTLKAEHKKDAATTRDKISNGVEQAKNSLNQKIVEFQNTQEAKREAKLRSA